MQSVYDAGGSGLFDVPQADRIVRTVPAPGLFTKYHGIYYFTIYNLLFYGLNGECIETAVHYRKGSGNEAGSVTDEVVNGSEQFFRLGKASAGSMGYDGFGAVCIGAIGISQQRTILVGQQETGNDSVYAELGAELGSQFGCHIAGIIADSGFG